MRYLFHRDFEKQLNKLSSSTREKFYERLQLFLENPFHPQLHTHPLRGKHEGSYSINITGDIRAIYSVVTEDVYEFGAIGTHHQLYGN